jgi:hypothetical protein
MGNTKKENDIIIGEVKSNEKGHDIEILVNKISQAVREFTESTLILPHEVKLNWLTCHNTHNMKKGGKKYSLLDVNISFAPFNGDE